MKIDLPLALCEEMGAAFCKEFNIDLERSYKTSVYYIKLDSLGKARLEKVAAALEGCKTKGAKSALADVRMFQEVRISDSVKTKRVRQFETALVQMLIRSARRNTDEGRPVGARVYGRDERRGVQLAYHVNKVTYHPTTKRDGYTSPAHVNVNLIWEEFDRSHGTTITFFDDDCHGLTAEEALAKKGLGVENAERYADYRRQKECWKEWHPKVGKQFLASGVASDDCDGNPEKRSDSWYWRQTNHITLDKNGEPSRVVVDLFFEDEKSDGRSRRPSDSTLDKSFWVKRDAVRDEDELGDNDDDDIYRDDDDAVNWDEIPIPYVPLHPMLACFDMKRHLRLRIHVDQLQEYEYDVRLGDKLVLPSDSRNLVEMLLAHKSQFHDIVKGKSGGAIILCAGLPGTGKTLTAEVYAEVMARPLYTVQASQLGTVPNDLEEELLKVFSRSARWNAILLLDEADVYVHRRGNDLQQNAIVGVFLRVLEYYGGVLFLTTNRSELVDDAIASRCVARIDYKEPAPEDQRRIWRILADSAKIPISDSVIEAVVERFPKLTGRDVKNLLKLSMLVAASRECAISLEVVRFVKRFKPTVTENEVADDGPVALPELRDLREVETPSATSTLKDSGVDWKATVVAVFNDGSPHSVAEVKDEVAKVAPEVHVNAITNVITQLKRGGQLSRLSSGLYRKEG